MSTNMTFALVMIGFMISIYLAGRIAERRGAASKFGHGLLRLSGRWRFHWCSCSPACTARTATMPKGPKGEKRPADVIGNAVHVK